MSEDSSLESQIAAWRRYLRRHASIGADDIAEMEDHLREQIADLTAVGLSDDEAFMVALGRLGSVDEISREFAREHSERLWKQLVLAPAPSPDGTGRTRRELPVVLALAAGAAIAVKAGLEWLDPARFSLTAGLFIAPFLAGYFCWKRRVAVRPIAVMIGVFVVLAAVLGGYPFHGAVGAVDAGGTAGPTDSAVLAAIHAPVVLWLVVGLAYTGGDWRSGRQRMNFIRFTGEFLVYYALLALGGGVLVGLTAGSFAAVGVDPSSFLADWVLPLAMPGAVLVAAWLVEAKQNVVENIAPVLTRVFTPLTIVMLLALLAAYVVARGAADSDRTLLIIMDLILVLVLGLLLYTISARDPVAPVGLLDWLQFVLVVAALAVDVLVLVAMLGRIVEFGTSPNKVAALGINLLLLVNLARSGWLTLAFARGRRPAAAAEAWQTRYLPVFGCWAAAVVAVLPPLFDFA